MMQKLSPVYRNIRQLRSRGDCAGAVALLRTKPPGSDDDAFEAVVCLFVCGDMESALNVCRMHPWKQEWAAGIASALVARFVSRDGARAVALARKALNARGAPPDAAALYLLLLNDAGFLDEARAYVTTRLADLPYGETFLLITLGETALEVHDWRNAYRAASAVLAADPDDYRALMVSSLANFEIGNLHEALGAAIRASFLDKGGRAAVHQIMRCHNRLGDYYAALAAYDKLAGRDDADAAIRVELATAYLGLEDRERAIAEYRAALARDPQCIEALRALVGIFASADEKSGLEALLKAHRGDIHADIESVYALALAALNRGELDEAAALFGETRALGEEHGEAAANLQWPVPEPRVRHDYEQLALLEKRGKLNDEGRSALALLKTYCDGTNVDDAFAPGGAEGETLRSTLARSYCLPEVAFSGSALGENDYAAIEARYAAERLVVIDDFLSAEALAQLRAYCEEATIWKVSNARGYVGAVLAQGFSPPVLLAIADQLRKAMPAVLGSEPLLQAWAFKYDQRMQGINMHADFARVNVNFWITPDEACEDPATGGMVVYDVPVPRSWTFAEYNTDSEKLKAYLEVHRAQPKRVPYRGNRCVLFDSSLIHITDELHFRPGYENRRVNVTLLYGKARTVE